MEDKILRFEITDRCNMKCKMCWSKEWEHKELDESDVKKLIYDFKNAGGRSIVLTSREPLLSKNFRLVVDICKEEEIDLKVLTNATMITDELAKYIVESQIISFIAISIHGKEKEHDMITGVDGSLKKAVNGIQLLNKYKKINHMSNPEIRLTTVISKNLIKSIDFIINIAKENNTQLRIQHLMWHPIEVKKMHKKIMKEKYGIDDEIIDGFSNNCEINANDIIKLLSYAENKCKKEKIDMQVYPKLTKEEIKRWYSYDETIILKNGYCDHVHDSVRVRANGEVSLCQYIDVLFGNITNKSIKSICDDDKLKKVEKDLQCGILFPICYRCCHVESRDVSIDKISNLKI